MTTETIVVALIAILLGSMVKSISGMGLPIIAIPTISFVADIETAATIVALPNLLVNLTMAWRARDTFAATRDLPTLTTMGLIGGAIGTFALVSWSEEPLVAILAAVVVLYVVTYLRSPDFSIGAATSRRLAPGVGLFAGLLQGAIGISGPVVGSWVHAYRLERRAHIFSVTSLFAVSGVAQFVILAVGGDLAGRWTVSVASCLPALATIPFGERLRDRFSSEAFDRFVVATLAITVCVLTVRTFA